jgi:PAS domain S-box-containing protein
MPQASSALPSETGSFRLRRLRLAALWFGVLIILAIALSSVYGAWQARRYAIAANERELSNLAGALADETAWTLEAVDLLLLDTAQWYSSEGRTLPRDRISASLEDRAAGVQEVRAVTIVDGQGKQLFSSRVSALREDVSDRSYFTAQMNGSAAGLFMSEPLVTRSEGRAAVELSRRLEDAQGHFAGVVTATLELSRLQQFYSAVDLGPISSIQLLRNDGLLIVRNPATPQAVGRYFPVLLHPNSTGVPRVVNPVDGRDDFIALAPVRNAPLTIAVTRSRAAALQPWREQTTGVLVRTLILTVLAALTLAALLRQIRRVAVSDRALRESEERYALAMEGANDGHWDWQIGPDRMFLSPKMKALFGQDVDAPIRSRSEWLAHITIHPDDRQRWEATAQRHLDGLTPRYECEYRVRQPDGGWRWVLSRGHCLRDSQGRAVRFVGSASDITVQKLQQTEREKLEAQLRQSQKMEAIGTLAGGIAHDFNNILGAILGYGELAQQHAQEGSPVRRYLDSVMHAAERAQMLVARILGFSRSGLGDRAPVNVQFVIEEALELLEASLPAGIRLESHLEAGNAAVIGDATYLHQVAMNLCTNAIQAMEGGGVLRVTLDCIEVEERRAVLRGALAPGRYVRLIVIDTGAGISPSVLERIFDPFFTTKGVGQGTGLGLSLVHGIVSDLGGAIDVWSRLGEGTRFEVWLPVGGETSTPTVETVRALHHGQGQSVMIVDDERALVALAEEVTAELGYEPVGFSSSGTALAAFRAQPGRFDVLLTDEAMPELPGTELAREVRRLRPDLPILLMSGYGGTQLTLRAAEIGINEVLRKPLHRRELAAALARVLATTSRS